MFEFVQRFFGKQPSSAMAKERLRLVLLSDHLSLAPEVVESLKRDLLEVISRYVEVDPSSCDVSFEQQDKQVAMLANIPIVAMRNRPTPPAAPPTTPAPPPPEPPPSLDPAGASAAVADEPEPEAVPDAPAAAAPGAAAPKRKRRRKRASGAPGFSAI
ncbi:MAG TPA: cell division topological specificity factor MinE [Candidatus Limnocylindria bacterium]|nr:cell division topological specificity factor MinE [Candidatus Limnocylindria bacterium]